MKTLLITHVYQQAKPYLTELFESINCQTDKDFDLLVFNYGLDVPLSDFGFFGREVDNKDNLGIPEARDWSLRYACENEYDLAIIVDADDVISKDRVEKTKEAFSDDFGFYYTKLNLLSDHEADFFKGQLPSSVDSIGALFHYNFIGLSHFAVNVRALAGILSKIYCPSNVIAYDWFLVSVLLLNGLKGKVIESTTYYRIYELNTAGFTYSQSPDKLLRTVRVKKIHYQVMADYCSAYRMNELSMFYRIKYKYYGQLLYLFESDSSNLINELLIANESANAFWWSSI